ncbi:MAG: glycine cleavage system aminomethyltransferase GcvT [Myxococcales bacterium]|nr:glycine cleavage system aminomethyltransferase GcvT [Myxococcales bacterium]
MSGLRQTPLYATHRRLGARLVEFGGFDMPVQYASILKEHAAVRETVGLFDVSHMGQIEISGPGALEATENLISCRVESLEIGRVRYGMLCNQEGGVVDDVTLYRRAEDVFMLCVNASNIEKDHAWIREHVPTATRVDNQSEQTGLMALQGPNAAAVLESVMGSGPERLERFQFGEYEWCDRQVLISSTGYTGAPGFEIYLAGDDTPGFFDALLEAGKPHGLLPAGLGARDTLRLEAALPLYGHELDDTTSPLEAGLGSFVKRKRGGFIGAEAIEARAAEAPTRRLVGFEMVGRGIARSGYAILKQGDVIGEVTSGAPSPSLGKSIGLGYVSPIAGDPESEIEIEIRGKPVAARVVRTPFVTKVDQKASNETARP